MKLFKPFNVNLTVIRCRCGAEVPLIQNVVEMSKAIEEHVEKHTKHIKSRRLAEAEAENVRDELIAKVLFEASETEP